MVKTRALAFILATLWLAAVAGCTPSTQLTVDRNVAIPMRDGVQLRADIYRPASGGPFPVLVFRTPYGKHNAAQSDRIHAKAVARGYAVVMQDVRGRYASDGIFDPYRQERADGYDTIEWAAAQPWSDGRIGTYGLSYPGAVQWLAAMESPPHLLSMAPAMTFSSPRNFFYMNGIFDLSWLPWIYQYVAPDARRRLGLPVGEDAEQCWPSVASKYQSWLPLKDLPWLRQEAPYYFEWLAHPPEDPWWDWAELRGRYAKCLGGGAQPERLVRRRLRRGRRGNQFQWPGAGEERAGQRADAPRARPVGARRAIVDGGAGGRPGFRAERRHRLRRAWYSISTTTISVESQTNSQRRRPFVFSSWARMSGANRAAGHRRRTGA